MLFFSGGTFFAVLSLVRQLTSSVLPEQLTEVLAVGLGLAVTYVCLAPIFTGFQSWSSHSTVSMDPPGNRSSW